MVKNVFFSFHYELDSFRANTIMHANNIQNKIHEFSENTSVDAWSQLQNKDDAIIESWIDEQIKKTSLTIVLIGSQTVNRKWVKKEIEKTVELGNALFAIRIHNCKDENGKTTSKGLNPLEAMFVEEDDEKIPLSELFVTYDWLDDDGVNNLESWINKSLSS